MGTEAVAIAKACLSKFAVQKPVYCFESGDRTSNALFLGANAVTESAIALAQSMVSLQIAIDNALLGLLRYL
ncbi:hypothetical protein NDI49_32785 [Trichocoleus sp. ST-U3]